MIVLIKSGILKGLRAKIIAKSSLSLTLELLEERKGWKVGSKVNLAHYEVEKI